MSIFNKKYKKGFTLIELLVVVAIIGLLSSIVLTSLNSARAKARDAKKISEFNQISKGLQLYYDKFGQYPDNNTTPPSGVPVGTNTQIVQFMNMAQLLVTNGFLGSVPAQPVSTNRGYSYHKYGPGVAGALLVTNLETKPSITGIAPSCRPMGAGNWCNALSTINSSYATEYCLCHPY